MKSNKESRLLKIFFDLIRGEGVNTRKLADYFQVSVRTIARDLSEIKCILADDRATFEYAELMFDKQSQTYYLQTDALLKSNEMLAIVKILLGSRGLEKNELIQIIEKLQKQISCNDKKLINLLMQKELYKYQEVKHDSGNVIGNLWKVSCEIEKKSCITITYYKMNRERVKRKVYPEAIVFSEYYFYLIAYDPEEEKTKYFRLDRIVDITVHRQEYVLQNPVNEGELKQKVHYMWPGEKKKIKFEFTGPSVQAVLDKIPTAQIIAKEGGRYTIEAEVQGDGIDFFLLSQGKWVKVLEPDSLVNKINQEIQAMLDNYTETKG